MNDTPALLQQQFRSMLMAKSGSDRLIMGSNMFDSARGMMLASFPKNLESQQIRRLLLQRTYPGYSKPGA
jgi:dihydrofolate reductase